MGDPFFLADHLADGFPDGACAMKYKYAFGSVSQPLPRMVPGWPPPEALAARGTAVPNWRVDIADIPS
jgi:hypothetical protein